MKHQCKQTPEFVSIVSSLIPDEKNFNYVEAWFLHFSNSRDQITFCPYCGERLKVSNETKLHLHTP